MSWVNVGIALATLAVGAYQQDRVADRQDDQAAAAIRTQSMLQRKADAKVNEQVQNLESSTAEDERAQRMDSYMDTMRANRGKLQAGLTPTFGSEAFRQDAANDVADVQQYAADTAGLMSRIDAAGMQRQGEAFGYGKLATDIGLIGRQSAGEDFMSRLRMSTIRRNPWIDAAVQAGGAYANSKAGSASGASGAARGGNPYSGGNFSGPR